MINKKLIPYVKKSIKEGYDILSIQDALIKRGYVVQDIFDTVDFVKFTMKSKIHIPNKQFFKKHLYLILAILIFMAIPLLFLHSSPKIVSEERLNKGIELILKENQKIEFNFEGETHLIKAISVQEDSAIILVQSNFTLLNLKVWEKKKLDLNGDGFYDVNIKLESIRKDTAKLSVRVIHESSCTVEWDCGNWSDCNGAMNCSSNCTLQKTRVCVDLNSCDTNEGKPDEVQNCSLNLTGFPGGVDEEITNCTNFSSKLESCTEFKCYFKHLITGEKMKREILGIVNGTCDYVEQMPENETMECKYNESMRKAVAKYYSDIANAESYGTSLKGNLSNQTVNYTIDGKEVANPLAEAISNGQCVISGYGI